MSGFEDDDTDWDEVERQSKMRSAMRQIVSMARQAARTIRDAPDQDEKPKTLTFAEHQELRKKETAVVETHLEKRARQMAEAEKAKMRKAAARKRAELQEKRTRGIAGISGFFTKKTASGEEVPAAQLTVRDKISGVARPLRENEKLGKILDVESSTDAETPATEEASEPRRALYTHCAPIEDGDRLVTASDCSHDPLLADAFRWMTSEIEPGCANQQACSFDECHHEADADISPLECTIKRGRGGRRRHASLSPQDPFNRIAFPLSVHLPRVSNSEPADAPINAPRRTDYYGQLQRMTSLSIESLVIRHRRVFHAQLADIGARMAKREQQVEQQLRGLRARAVSRRDSRAISELDLDRNRRMATINAMRDRELFQLNAATRNLISRDVGRCAQSEYFKLPHVMSANAIFGIVSLRDGDHRDDKFYEQMAHQVRLGNLTALNLEADRERREHEKLISGQKQLDAKASDSYRRTVELDRRIAATAPRSSEEIIASFNNSARKRKHVVRVPDTPPRNMKLDTPPLTPPRPPTLANARAATSPAKKPKSVAAEPKAVAEDWKSFAEWTLNPCDSQGLIENGAAACTPIAFFAAVRLVSLKVKGGEESIDAQLRGDFPYKKVMFNGAAVWKAWSDTQRLKEGNHASTFMLAHEVLGATDALATKVKKLSIKCEESCGPWSSSLETSHTEDAAELHMPFEEKIAAIQAAAPSGQFSAILTIGSSSIAIACIGSAIYVFDSHACSNTNYKSTIAKFKSIEIACKALRARYGDSSAGDTALVDPTGSLVGHMYSLFALHREK